MPNFNLRNISEGDKLVEFKTQNGWFDYNREGSIGNIVVSSDEKNLSACLKEPVGPSISCVDATNIASIETTNGILEVNGVIINGVSYPYTGQLVDINETHDLSDLIEVMAEFEPNYVTHIRSKRMGSNVTIALSPSATTPIVGMENNPTIGIDDGLLTLCLSERQYYGINYPDSLYIDKPTIISIYGQNSDITDINELRLVTNGGDITVGPPELSNGQISWNLTANTGEELTVTIVDATGLQVDLPYTYVPKELPTLSITKQVDEKWYPIWGGTSIQFQNVNPIWSDGTPVSNYEISQGSIRIEVLEDRSVDGRSLYTDTSPGNIPNRAIRPDSPGGVRVYHTYTHAASGLTLETEGMDYYFHGLAPYANLGIFDKGVVRQVQLKEYYSATDALPSDWVLTLEDRPETTPYVDKLTLTFDPNVRGLVTGNPIEYGGFSNVTDLVVHDGEGNLIIRQQLQFSLEQEGTVIFKYANATNTTMFEMLQSPRSDSPVTGSYWASVDPVYGLPFEIPVVGASLKIWPNPQGYQPEGELRIRPAKVGDNYAMGTLSIRAAVSELVDFGNANITINSSHLTKVPATLPPTISSIELMADNLNDPSIVNWKIEDTQITSMRSMFNGCDSFNQPIGHWNVSKVTDMTALFAGCSSFNQPLNDWDVSKVVLFENMFVTATVFDQPLDKWVTQSAVNMNSMFWSARAFNQDISGWEVDNVGFMENMFQGATLFSQDLSGWCVGKVVESSKSNWASPAMTPEQIPVWGTCPNGPVRNYTLTIDGPNSVVKTVPTQFTHTFEVAGVPGTTNKTEWKLLFGTGKITNTGLLTTSNYEGKITLVLVVNGVYSAFREINVTA